MTPLRQCSQRCSCYAYSLTNRTPIHFPSRSFVSKREYLSSPLIIAVTTRIPLNAHIFRSIYTHYQSPVTVPARPLPQRGVLHTDYRLLVVPAVYVVKPDAYLLVASNDLHFITTVRALDAFKPGPIRENALTCYVGAD